MARADSHLGAGVVVAALLSAMLIFRWSFSGTSETMGSRAFIKVQGRIVRIVELSGDGNKAAYSVRGMMGRSTVEVEGKRIRMSEAPCPDRICVKQGWIERPGDFIVCIPNQVEIYIESGNGLDALTR